MLERLGPFLAIEERYLIGLISYLSWRGEGMFKIIDRTLSALQVDEDHLQGEMLFEMCSLLNKVGVDYIELSVPILEKMGKLPDKGHYILQIESLEEKERYLGFDLYVWKGGSGQMLDDDMMSEIQVKHVDEVIESKMSNQGKYIRLTGLDKLMCTDYKLEIKKLMEYFKAPIDFCPKDSCYCATALAIEWLMNGGKSISVSFNGIGGYAKLEEVMMSIKVIMNKKIGMDLSVLPRMSMLYEKLTQSRIHYNKAVLGKNIFNIEAGIQVDGSKHEALAYEPYDPTVVGKIRRLVIGKHSGSRAIRLKLEEKGVKVSDEVVKALLSDIKVSSMNKGRSLTDKEFLLLVKEVATHEA